MNKELLIELANLDDRLLEDRLYEIAVEEIERGEFDGVAKAKAFEEADGNEQKSRAYYTKHRVRRIKDMLTAEAIKAAVKETEEASRSRSEKNVETISNAKKLVKSTTDRIITLILSTFIFVASFALVTQFLLALGLNQVLSIVISFATAALLASKFTDDKHDNKPKVAKGRSVHSYRGYAIYEIKDGYKAMGAWFPSIEGAQLYIDNNYNSFKKN